MLRILLCYLFCVILIGCQSSDESLAISDFNSNYENGEDGQIIAFVGEKISLYNVPYEEWCGENEICLDARYNARYRVIEVLKGNYESPIIDFEVYDHSARIPFYPHKRVILYVGQYGERLVHEKYQYDLLSPLKGGGFAVCGDPYVSYDADRVKDIGREPLTPYQFDPPIIKKISEFLPEEEDEQDEFQDDVREKFLDGIRNIAPPAFEIRGSTAICRMGVSAQEAANIWFEFRVEE